MVPQASAAVGRLAALPHHSRPLRGFWERVPGGILPGASPSLDARGTFQAPVKGCSVHAEMQSKDGALFGLLRIH